MHAPDIQFLTATAETQLLQADADLIEFFRTRSVQEILVTAPQFRDEAFRYDPLHLLGLTATYILIWSSRPSIERNPGYRLEIANLEVLQSMVLTSLPKSHKPIIDPGDVENFWTRLRQLHFASAQLDGSCVLSGRQQNLASQVKLHSAFYRNAYGRAFFERMMFSIAGEYDCRYGSRLLPFFSWLLALLDEIDKRFEAYRERVEAISKADRQTVTKIVRDLADRNARAMFGFRSVDADHLPDEAFRVFCHNVQEACVEETFRFTRDQIQALSPQPDYEPFTTLELASLSFGHLVEQGIQDLSSSNPVWSKPFVREGEHYFLFSPLTVLSFPFHLFFSVAGGDPRLTKLRVERLRGDFVEKECEDLLRTYLPTAQVISGAFWYDEDGSRCETDVLAILANKIVVFEAKGAVLPDRVKDGNFVKAKSFFQNTHGVASRQVDRFISRLRNSSNLQLFNRENETTINIDCSKVRDIVGYSLTIDQIGPLANARSLQVDCGIIPENSSAPPIMLPELRAIFETLDHEIYRLHYLFRRNQLFQSIDLVGDEGDVFGLYVLYGFANVPLDGYSVMSVLGASYYVREYIQNGTVVIPETSSLANTSYFDRVLLHVLTQKPQGYLDFAFAILDSPAAAQTAFEEAMSEIRRATTRADSRLMQLCEVPVLSGLTSLVLVGSVYGDVDREDRNATLSAALTAAIRKRGLRAGFLIGRQLGFEKYAYSIMMFLRAEDISAELAQ